MPSPADPRYRAVHAYLSDDAHIAWQDVSTELGVSISGLIEAIGLDLTKPADERVLTSEVPQLVRVARKVDATRRRRTNLRSNPS